MMELIPCANPDYNAKHIQIRLSSPVRPEEVWQLQLGEPYVLQPLPAGALVPSFLQHFAICISTLTQMIACYMLNVEV